MPSYTSITMEAHRLKPKHSLDYRLSYILSVFKFFCKKATSGLTELELTEHLNSAQAYLHVIVWCIIV